MKDVTRFITQIVSDPPPSTYTSKTIIQAKEWGESSLYSRVYSHAESFVVALQKELHSISDDAFTHDTINQCLVRVIPCRDKQIRIGEAYPDHRKKLMAALRLALTGSKSGFVGEKCRSHR